MNETALNANVGHRLRALRLSKSIKQADAARELGRQPRVPEPDREGQAGDPLPSAVEGAALLRGRPRAVHVVSSARAASTRPWPRLLDEPLLKTLDLDPESLQSLSAEPKLAGTVAALFNLYKNTRTQLENVMAQLSSEERARTGRRRRARLDYSPFDEVTDFLQAHHNYFPELEEEAEAVAPRLRRSTASLTSTQLMSRAGESLRLRHPLRGAAAPAARWCGAGPRPARRLTLSPIAHRAAAQVPARRHHRPAGARPHPPARTHGRREDAATPRRPGSSRSTSPTTSPAP